ncbi:hypothetical protein [Atopobium sp. oral taxon 810]|uniref:hypothetical protein n=1 Tax=Atopobium sp. oral taxon 810 TaxID=712158 RepID=UPI0004248E0B|nr:hypothetical protein [Atopobium sp. oral taxon 810]
MAHIGPQSEEWSENAALMSKANRMIAIFRNIPIDGSSFGASKHKTAAHIFQKLEG